SPTMPARAEPEPRVPRWQAGHADQRPTERSAVPVFRAAVRQPSPAPRRTRPRGPLPGWYLQNLPWRVTQSEQAEIAQPQENHPRQGKRLVIVHRLGDRLLDLRLSHLINLAKDDFQCIRIIHREGIATGAARDGDDAILNLVITDDDAEDDDVEVFELL